MPRVVHFELPTTNIELSKKFYETVLGWKLEKYGGPVDYMMIMTGDPKTPGIDGGLGGAANELKATVNTVEVDDLDAMLKKVLSNGGQIVMPKDEIPSVGYLAYIREPGGAVLGLLQPLPGMSM
jgi:predicted enzyme related to lactoylglutathione lyase